MSFIFTKHQLIYIYFCSMKVLHVFSKIDIMCFNHKFPTIVKTILYILSLKI